MRSFISGSSFMVLVNVANRQEEVSSGFTLFPCEGLPCTSPNQLFMLLIFATFVSSVLQVCRELHDILI